MKILICFLFVLITSCRTIELPYSSCCNLVPKWRECIEVKVTNNKIYLGSDKINNYSSIYDWINRYRATYKEGVNLYANMYIDKNCLYSRVDSIIEQLRKSYILRFHIKTNSLKDSCFVDISFLPLGAYCDSLENELISKTPLEKESINLFLVSDYKDDSYIVNNRVMNKLDLIIPKGCGTLPSIFVKYPGCCDTRTDLKPEEPGCMPQTVANKSYNGLALHAWQSERDGSGFSAKVVRPFSIISFQISRLSRYRFANPTFFIALKR